MNFASTQSLHQTNLQTYSGIDVSIRTVLDPTTLDDHAGSIIGIRFACAVYQCNLPTFGGSGTAFNTHTLEISGANMTVLPLHIEDKGSGS